MSDASAFRIPFDPENPLPVRESIYFYDCGHAIKVGFSTNVPSRLFSFPSGRLLGTVRGSIKAERQLHRDLALNHRCVNGREWYEPTSSLRAAVADLLRIGAVYDWPRHVAPYPDARIVSRIEVPIALLYGELWIPEYALYLLRPRFPWRRTAAASSAGFPDVPSRVQSLTLIDLSAAIADRHVPESWGQIH